MVYVNGTKFACASCIKGHRSSSCHHSERPLFEIKKKGRPISQCEKCRELRKNRRMHVRCTCGQPSFLLRTHPIDEPDLDVSSQRPVQRKLPVAPSLPNGISDFYKPQVKYCSGPQKVVNLLNPCQCLSPKHCICSPLNGNTGIQTLRRESVLYKQNAGNDLACGFSKSRDTSVFDDDLKLPPLKWFGPGVSDESTKPELLLPPFSTLCGSNIDPFRRCTCGSSCICLGCKEHRRSNGTNSADCPDMCGTCVDNLSFDRFTMPQGFRRSTFIY